MNDPLLERAEQEAIEVLQKHDLHNQNGRPFDSRFAVFGETAYAKERLIVVGYNGNSSDACWTNREAIEHGRYNPEFFNLEEGLKDHQPWGRTMLPGNLDRLTRELGFSPKDTVYTNAILKCSANALALRATMNREEYVKLMEASMNFFLEFTLRSVRPAAIVVYGNGQNPDSAANIVRSRLSGYSGSVMLDDSQYWLRAFWFEGEAQVGNDGANSKIPVLCVTHLSRWFPSEKTVSDFRKIIRNYN
jgi:hypothetical protein